MANVTSSKMVKNVFGFTLLFILCLSIFCPASVLAAVANAGDDQEVISGQTVVLDATGSPGEIIRYEWMQTKGPPYVDLGEQAFMPQPSFTAPEVQAETELEFQLYITDDLGQTDLDWVSIWVYPSQNGDEGPTADAGEDQHCIAGDTVTLDGTGSTGTEITYQWEQVRSRASEVSLNQADSAQPSFEAPPYSLYNRALRFQLTVIDADERIDTDLVSVLLFPAGTTIQITPAGDPLGIRVADGSILNRYIITTPDFYTSTITGQGQEPVDLPHGLADISIQSESPVVTGTVVYSTTTTFYLPTAALPDYGWAKLSLNNGWMDFSDNVVFNPDRTVVTMTLTDGGPGDDNAAAGIIDDPSGLALMADGNRDDGSGGSSSSGGCFIMTCWPR